MKFWLKLQHITIISHCHPSLWNNNIICLCSVRLECCSESCCMTVVFKKCQLFCPWAVLLSFTTVSLLMGVWNWTIKYSAFKLELLDLTVYPLKGQFQQNKIRLILSGLWGLQLSWDKCMFCSVVWLGLSWVEGHIQLPSDRQGYSPNFLRS